MGEANFYYFTCLKAPLYFITQKLFLRSKNLFLFNQESKTNRLNMENVECLICYAQAHNPSLCAQCSKVFCDSCLQTHFKRNTRTCPHCRAPVGQKANGFVNVKWLPELMEDVGGSSVVARVETCQLHRPKQKTIFCADCKLTCCLDCSKVEHSNHRLEAIELAHDAMRENIFSLYHNAKAVEKVEDYSRRQYEEILALREEGQRRIAKLEEDLRRRLDSEIEALQTSTNYVTNQYGLFYLHTVIAVSEFLLSRFYICCYIHFCTTVFRNFCTWRE